MKILHTVEFYDPSVGGMQEVVRQVSTGLVKLGHDVTVATTALPDRKSLMIDGVKIKEFAIKGSEVRGYQGEILNYQNFLLESDFDIVINFAAQQWATDLALPILDKIKGKKIFAPTGFSGLFDPDFKEYFSDFYLYLQKYCFCVYSSSDYRDINYARDFGLQNSVVFPNGASEKEFEVVSDYNFRKEYDLPETTKLIVTLGSHSGVKGHKEAMQVFEQAGLKNCALLIIANVSHAFAVGCQKDCQQQAEAFNQDAARVTDANKVLVVDLPRAATVATLKQADVFLFLSNVECSPIVLVEAMASKLPILTSDVGNTREIITRSNCGQLLPTNFSDNGYSFADVTASAKILHDFMEDEQTRKELGENGYRDWKEKYSWEKITRDYESLYKQALEMQSVPEIQPINELPAVEVIAILESADESIQTLLKDITAQTLPVSKTSLLNLSGTPLNAGDLALIIQMGIVYDASATGQDSLCKLISSSNAKYIAIKEATTRWKPRHLELLLRKATSLTTPDLAGIYGHSAIKFDPFLRGKLAKKITNKEFDWLRISDFLLVRDRLPQNFVVDSGLGHYMLKPLLFLITRESTIDYIFQTTVQHQHQTDNVEFVTAKCSFINRLSEDSAYKQYPLIVWGSEITNKIIAKFPDRSYYKIAEKSLTKTAKLRMFPSTKGSIKQFTVKRQILHAVRDTKKAFKYIIQMLKFLLK